VVRQPRAQRLQRIDLLPKICERSDPRRGGAAREERAVEHQRADVGGLRREGRHLFARVRRVRLVRGEGRGVSD